MSYIIRKEIECTFQKSQNGQIDRKSDDFDPRTPLNKIGGKIPKITAKKKTQEQQPQMCQNFQKDIKVLIKYPCMLVN